MTLLLGIEPCTKDLETLQAGLSRLLGLANELCEGVRAGQGHVFMEQQIDRLLESMARQFSCEEMLLERMHYAGTASQRHEHENLVEWLKQMRARLVEHALPSPPLQVSEFLRDWLSEHVRRSDQSYLSELGSRESW